MRKFRILNNNNKLDKTYLSGYDCIVLSLNPRDKKELNYYYNQSKLNSVIHKAVYELNMNTYGVKLRNFNENLYMIYDFHRDTPYGLTGILNLLKVMSICRSNNFKRILILVYKDHYAHILHDIYEFLAMDNNIDIDIISIDENFEKSYVDIESCLCIPRDKTGLKLEIFSERGGKYKRDDRLGPRIIIGWGKYVLTASLSLDEELNIIYGYNTIDVDGYRLIEEAKRYIRKNLVYFKKHYNSRGDYTDEDLLKDLTVG